MLIDKFEEKIKKYPKTVAYVLSHDTHNIRCRKCGNIVLHESTLSSYPYQCLECDENLYEFETEVGKNHSCEELLKLIDDALCFELDDDYVTNILGPKVVLE